MFKYTIGEEVIYCSQLCVIVKRYKADNYVNKQPKYDVTYQNDFSTLNSRSVYVREDLIYKQNKNK